MAEEEEMSPVSPPSESIAEEAVDAGERAADRVTRQSSELQGRSIAAQDRGLEAWNRLTNALARHKQLCHRLLRPKGK